MDDLTMKYTDRTGASVKAGDILAYDEGVGGAKQIHEVLDINGTLHAVARVGEPCWTIFKNETPILLKYYTTYPHANGFLTDATVIGNIVNDYGLLSKSGAEKTFGIFQNARDNLTIESIAEESGLTDREVAIMQMRHSGMTLETIGFNYEVTKERIRQIINKAQLKMHAAGYVTRTTISVVREVGLTIPNESV